MQVQSKPSQMRSDLTWSDLNLLGLPSGLVKYDQLFTSLGDPVGNHEDSGGAEPPEYGCE